MSSFCSMDEVWWWVFKRVFTFGLSPFRFALSVTIFSLSGSGMCVFISLSIVSFGLLLLFAPPPHTQAENNWYNIKVWHNPITSKIKLDVWYAWYLSHENVFISLSAYPSLPYPVIDRCVSNIVKQNCYALITYNDTISCEVTHSRPSVHLTWLMKTRSNESDVTRDLSYSPMGDLNTTVATMRFQRSLAVRFHLFICESSSTTVLRNLSSFIIAEVNEGRMKFDYEVAVKTQIGSMLTLPCNGVTSLLVLWKIIMTNGQNRIIGYVYEGVEYSESPYILHQNGTLMFQFNEEHVDLYLCITTTGSREEIIAYDVTFSKFKITRNSFEYWAN